MKYNYYLVFDESKFWECSCREEDTVHLATWLFEYFSEDIQSITFDHIARRVTVSVLTTWGVYEAMVEMLDNRYPYLLIDASM